MKELIKKYAVMILLVGTPWLTLLTDNTTVNALAATVVWGVLIVLIICCIIIAVASAVMQYVTSEPEFTRDEKVIESCRQAYDAFNHMKWWKTLINVVLVLGTYIYLEWAAPAVVYTIFMVVLMFCLAWMKNSFKTIGNI